MQSNQILSPCLWYDGKAEEAVTFYVIGELERAYAGATQ